MKNAGFIQYFFIEYSKNSPLISH